MSEIKHTLLKKGLSHQTLPLILAVSTFALDSISQMAHESYTVPTVPTRLYKPGIAEGMVGTRDDKPVFDPFSVLRLGNVDKAADYPATVKR